MVFWRPAGGSNCGPQPVPDSGPKPALATDPTAFIINKKTITNSGAPNVYTIIGIISINPFEFACFNHE